MDVGSVAWMEVVWIEVVLWMYAVVWIEVVLWMYAVVWIEVVLCGCRLLCG